MEWGALVAAPAAALSNERSNGSPRMLSTLCEDSGVLLVQGPKRFHNLIKFYATAALLQSRRRLTPMRRGSPAFHSRKGRDHSQRLPVDGTFPMDGPSGRK